MGTARNPNSEFQSTLEKDAGQRRLNVISSGFPDAVIPVCEFIDRTVERMLRSSAAITISALIVPTRNASARAMQNRFTARQPTA